MFDTYFKMRKKIDELEKYGNIIDYPESMMKKRLWTIKYLYELYARSVNGARSAKAIAHLKKVNNVIHATLAGGSILLAILGIVELFSLFASQK